MNIIYSDQNIVVDARLKTHSIFLAGPTPSDTQTKSWRPEAVDILNKLNYKGVILYPERTVKQEHINYDDQVEWEHKGLTECTHILFWVPRNMDTLPAFTTNIEFGRFAHYRQTFYGRPDTAPKNRYLDWYYKKVNTKPIYNNLEELLKATII